MDITLKKLGSSRTQATVIFDEALVQTSEKEVIVEIGKNIEIKGFRPGQAPPEKLREQVPPERIHEEVIRRNMPDLMKELVEEHKLTPIIRPRVELNSLSPFTVVVVIVEQPTVKVSWKKIKLPKEKKAKASKDEKAPELSEEEQKKKADEEREQKLLELLIEHTAVDLAPELVEDELQAFIEDHGQRLKQYGMELEQWLTQIGKSFEEFIKEVRPEAEKRLKVRFAVTSLIDEWKVEMTDEEMQEAIDTFLKPLSDDERSKLQEVYKKGENAYEQFKYQKMVEKVFERLRGA